MLFWMPLIRGFSQKHEGKSIAFAHWDYRLDFSVALIRFIGLLIEKMN